MSLLARAINRLLPVSPPVTDHVATWVRENRSGTVLPLRDEHKVALCMARTVGRLDPAFAGDPELRLPLRYLAKLGNVQLRGRDGFLILPDGSYASEAWDVDWLKPHPAYKQRIQAKAELISSPCLSLLSLHCREHYHWIADALARLHRVVAELPPGCRFVVPEGLKSDQLNLLYRLGIPAESLIHFDGEHPLVFDEFWFASPAAPDRFDDPEAVTWLRSRFWPEDREGGGKPEFRIFVSRQHASTRRLVNEEELYPILGNHGFQVVRPELLSMREQAWLFSRAGVVLGGHGAGFTNILFCRAGAKLIELFPERVSFRTYYRSLASACGVEYWYLLGRSVAGAEVEHADFRIEPDSLAELLRRALEL